jgi:hypothetical protein
LAGPLPHDLAGLNITCGTVINRLLGGDSAVRPQSFGVVRIYPLSDR